jgi:hypothetical protein
MTGFVTATSVGSEGGEAGSEFTPLQRRSAINSLGVGRAMRSFRVSYEIEEQTALRKIKLRKFNSLPAT